LTINGECSVENLQNWHQYGNSMHHRSYSVWMNQHDSQCST